MKKPVKIIITAAADIALTGAALCVFALFHHVLPQDYSDTVVTAAQNDDIHAITTATDTQPPETTAPTEVAAEKNTSAETERTHSSKPDGDKPSGGKPSKTTDEAATTATAADITTNEETTTTAVITTNAETTITVVTTTAADITTNAETTTPPQTTSGEAEIISTDTYYKSSDVTVTLTDYDVNGYVYHVEDIYIANAENLKTAFALDTYGKGYRESTPDMAAANNAICAINGDYYGNGDSGVVIRNGTLYRSDPDADVCVMYYDGTMKCFSESEFDGDAEMAAGAYQAWCFGPTLVSDGVAATVFPHDYISNENPRSAIGYFGAGHYCFVAVDGRSSESDGVTLKELAVLMRDLGCSVAYNLDGGKSSVMTFGDKVANVPSDGGRTISDIIYIAEIGG